MRVTAENQAAEPVWTSLRPARVLVAGAAICLVGAGLLLWWHRGAAVFSDVVLAAIAWCF
jgi:hypothetical protein